MSRTENASVLTQRGLWHDSMIRFEGSADTKLVLSRNLEVILHILFQALHHQRGLAHPCVHRAPGSLGHFSSFHNVPEDIRAAVV